MLRSAVRPPKLFVGAKLRRAREGQRLSQVGLARKLGLSPSYLNQIERDQRPLPRLVIGPICAALGVDVHYFDDSDEARAAHDLREASADPLFGTSAVTLEEAVSTVRVAPAVAERFVALYRAYLAGRETEAARTGEVSSQHAGGGTGQPYDDVRDWVQAHRNYFAQLDLAAEEQGERLELFLGSSRLGRLVAHFASAHGLRVASAVAWVAS